MRWQQLVEEQQLIEGMVLEQLMVVWCEWASVVRDSKALKPVDEAWDHSPEDSQPKIRQGGVQNRWKPSYGSDVRRD